MVSVRNMVLVITFLISVLSSSTGYAGHPTIISFDAPGAGSAQGLGTGCFGCTFAINRSGVVVGTYNDANNTGYGFLRYPSGKIVGFQAKGADTSPGYGTVAQSINDFGEITGYYLDSSGAAHGFLRSPKGRYTSFDPPTANASTVPVFINDEGAVVGYAFDANFHAYAFLRRPDGTFAVFTGPNECAGNGNNGCYGNEATYVTLLGLSVGNYLDNSGNFVAHGLLRSATGKLTVFDAPGAGNGSALQGTGCPGCNMGVNVFGEIAGTYVDPNNVIHGFLRSPSGKFTSFDAPGAGTGYFQGTGCYSDCPISLNDWGLLAGSYWDDNYNQHGYLRTPEGLITGFDPPESISTQPESINDEGTVAGYYVDANGVYHGFLLLP